jgi:endoglucanase
MNADWGFIETKDIAPVWIGEMGCAQSSTDTDGSTWEATMLPYIDGQDGAAGGPVFRGADQSISTDLWRWGSQPGVGDGCLNAEGQIRPEIASFVDGLYFIKK